MRIKLMYKMMISFMLIIILGGVIVAFTINHSTSRSFTELVRESDTAYAEELSARFALYYKEFGSWEGVGSVLNLPAQMGMQGAGMMRGQRAIEKESGMYSGEHQPGRGQFRLLPVILIDPNGRIIFSNIDITELKIPEDSGISIFNAENKIIATLYAGSMIGSKLLPVQNDFLDSVKRAIFLASIAVIIFTFIIGYFLVIQITRPIRKLQKASNKIAKGDLSVRVDINSNDELGDLATGFNSMTKSLEEAEQWKRQIIADSAHELRTPVALIQGHLEMMLEGIYLIDREGIQTILNETLRLSTLISELQELSSAEAGHSSFLMEKISLEDLLYSVINTFKPKLNDNNIILNTEINDIPEITADRQKIHQVLVNVISNALKFTSYSGLIIIKSWYEEFSNLVNISIEDNGPGIPLKERNKIFDRFYRIDKNRNRDSGGSGLGLAISREIISRHGGTIKAVDPVSGRGTCILITLPV